MKAVLWLRTLCFWRQKSRRSDIIASMYRFRILELRKIAVAVAMMVLGSAFCADETEPCTDVELWNRGVDMYRAGNYTNALATLKPLLLSKTHGARASELVGAIEFAEGLKRDGDGCEKPLLSLESAAFDFQSALRSNPADPRMNRNFTRAVDRIPELRVQARVEKVMKELGQQDVGSLLGAGVKDARALLKEFPEALTNDARRTVPMCDAMAKRAEKLCDTWIAVKAGVAQSVTNEQQAMTINAQVEEARSATELAAIALSDVNIEAQEHLKKAETSFTRFWKLAIMPPAACDESILAQTNELLKVENEYGRDHQQEALEFTCAFRAKFPAWAQAYEQQAQSDTNKPPFTKEAQAEISALATEVEKLQIELAEGKDGVGKIERKGGGKSVERAAAQFEVLKKLSRIRELLPKDGNGGGGQNQNQNQQNQKQNENKDENKDQKQDQDQSQDQRENQQEKDREEEKKEQSAAEEQEKKGDDQVEDILRRAQERSDQHDADKKERMKKSPLPANERDW